MSPRLKILVELFASDRNDFKILRKAVPELASIVDRLEQFDKEIAALVIVEMKP